MEPVPAGPPDPEPLPRPPRRLRFYGPRLNLGLLALTVATTTIAGALMDQADYARSWRDLFEGLLSDPSRLLSGLPFSLSILGILGAHEMGHYLACRFYGIPASLPYFIPGIVPFGTFGAVIRIRGRIPDRRALFDMAAAGPIAGFLVALPMLALGIMSARPADSAPLIGFAIGGTPLGMVLFQHPEGVVVDHFYVAGWFGMLITSINLFPVGQLDGGHLAYAISRRLHRVLAWISIAAVGTLVIGTPLLTTPWVPSVYTLWLFVLLYLRDRHPPLMDEVTPLGRGRVLIALLLAGVFLFCFIPLPWFGAFTTEPETEHQRPLEVGAPDADSSPPESLQGFRVGVPEAVVPAGGDRDQPGRDPLEPAPASGVPGTVVCGYEDRCVQRAAASQDPAFPFPLHIAG